MLCKYKEILVARVKKTNKQNKTGEQRNNTCVFQDSQMYETTGNLGPYPCKFGTENMKVIPVLKI